MDPERFFFSLREQTPHVADQGDQGICQIMAMADMAGTVLRGNGSKYEKLVISPQVLIDACVPDIRSAIEFYTEYMNPDRGVEGVNSYPFSRLRRSSTVVEYQEEHKDRYFLDYIDYEEGALQQVSKNVYSYLPGGDLRVQSHLVKMFMQGGSRYPCVGTLRMGPFERPDIAKYHADRNNPPYHHRKEPRSEKEAKKLYGGEHSVLITGIDTVPEDMYYRSVEVKNTHGTGWGNDGFSRVGFGVFEYVLVPGYEE